MRKLLFNCLFICISFLFCGCVNKTSESQVTEIIYWQYWSGFEGKAIEKLVDKFNCEHKNIKVKMLTISEPRKKILLSIIGGVPPDVVSTIAAWVPELSSRDALIPLDELCTEYMISRNIFIPVFWDVLNYSGHTWALPTTPTSTALFWNKDIFKNSGLNPDIPPKTLSELENFSSRITMTGENGRIIQIGFLPSWPSWAGSVYAILFNGGWGKIVNDGNIEITANCPENIKAWKWAQGFVDRLGKENIQLFQEEFGNYQGPNNPFYTGKIAIEVNGIWEANFISKFAPHLNWGCANLPTLDGKPTTVVDTDCIAIPRGSRHPKEAFEFISWLLMPENIEQLCIEQKKFSPLIYSDRDDFIRKHPNPYIKVFIELAKSRRAKFFPPSPIYQLYARELKKEFESVIKLQKTPEESLNYIQRKIENEIKKV